MALPGGLPPRRCDLGGAAAHRTPPDPGGSAPRRRRNTVQQMRNCHIHIHVWTHLCASGARRVISVFFQALSYVCLRAFSCTQGMKSRCMCRELFVQIEALIKAYRFTEFRGTSQTTQTSAACARIGKNYVISYMAIVASSQSDF